MQSVLQQRLTQLWYGSSGILRAIIFEVLFSLNFSLHFGIQIDGVGDLEHDGLITHILEREHDDGSPQHQGSALYCGSDGVPMPPINGMIPPTAPLKTGLAPQWTGLMCAMPTTAAAPAHGEHASQANEGTGTTMHEWRGRVEGDLRR